METERRKLRTSEIPVRKELENYVIAWNTALREVVGKMDSIILLRNANPAHRGEFAMQFKNAGLISKDEAREFVKIL